MYVSVEETSNRLADLAVTITPQCTQDRVTNLAIRVQISNSHLKPDDVVVKMPLELAKIPTTRYDGDSLKASDDLGPLPLVIKDDAPGPPIIYRSWTTQRANLGDIVVTGVASPRKVDKSTQSGPAFDLREDNCGLVGSGYSFLPLPPDGEDNSCVKLHFELGYAPQWCQSAWTHAHSFSQPTTWKSTKPSALHSALYMVGPIHSLDSTRNQTAVGVESESLFGVYWLSRPPFDIEQVAAECRRTYKFICDLFEDSGQSFRIFIRRDPYPVVRGGLAQPRCFLLSFGSLLGEDSTNFEFFGALFTHETIHTWLTLDELEILEKGTQWYHEGLAEYYSLFFRYMNGSLDREVLRKEANIRAQAYYTSPLVDCSDLEASKRSWQTANAQHLPYRRGFVFFVQLNALIESATNGKRTLVDLVIFMVKKSQELNKPLGLEDFLSRLEEDLGSNARHLYEHMACGKLVIPPRKSLLPGLVLERRDMETFDLGFDEASILKGPRVVTELKQGSRAAAAGILNGDEIIKWTDLNRCKENFELKMEVTVRREGFNQGEEELNIAFWPRSWEKAEGYQWVSEEFGLK
ncbi:hypothetical protein EDB81DRAFT_886381 [Dactylonectria macrodidyma]|uniref:Peptidase M61 catalytic domain-containing protein n=1 Tax=Dactylonectria macrodidyma TaxID=307937 RepID=A0A9P9EF37_9HYPO|nr:hypothetical protein EDB81DRAFT_886381 [Dactylonectria macrodidyma]